MSNVIQFLENLGKNGTMNRLSPADYAVMVGASGLDFLPKVPCWIETIKRLRH